jgi:hypothetical protein
MAAPGRLKADIRHLHLHRVALDKLRVEPARRAACIVLVDRWLASPAQASSRPPWLKSSGTSSTLAPTFAVSASSRRTWP